MYARILVPLDGSERAEGVLPHVQALAEKFGSTITLLRVTTSPEALIPPAPMGMGLPVGDFPPVGRMPPEVMDDYAAMAETERKETANYLDKVANSLKGKGAQVVTEAVEGSAADLIVE